MKAGIYRIHCITSNKIYIGSSKNINNRVYEHKRSLRHNKHYNGHLQSAWNKYGEANFIFSTIEKTEDLLNREHYWIKYYESDIAEKGYNIYDPLAITEKTFEKAYNSNLSKRKKGVPVVVISKGGVKEYEKITLACEDLKLPVKQASRVIYYWDGKKLKGCRSTRGYILVRKSLYNEAFDYLNFKKERVWKHRIPKEKPIRKIKPIEERNYRRVKIQAENVTTGEISEFASISLCERTLGLNNNKVRKCLDNEYKKYKHKGFYFKIL